MSEDRGVPPASIAEGLYGKDGPISGGPADPRTRAVIESGFARPDPRFTDDQARPSSAPERGAREPAFDATRYRSPDGTAYDQDLMAELSATGVSRVQGERLIELHGKAVKASEEAYAKSLEQGVDQLTRELHPEHLQAARDLINDERYTPREMREWLGRWGSHPGIARMLVNWAGLIRGGRY
jgi:hypothetical protein